MRDLDPEHEIPKADPLQFEGGEIEPHRPEAQAAHVWETYLEPAFDADGEQPVFAVLHEIDPHAPYDAPESFQALYDFGYAGNVHGWGRHDLADNMRMLRIVNTFRPWLGEADRRALRAQYMAEVSFVDSYVGALLENAASRGGFVLEQPGEFDPATVEHDENDAHDEDDG